MLGLGVNRLKTRPSLLDLIASRGVDDQVSSVTVDGSSSSPPGPANLPPLPPSPTSTTSSWSYSNSNSNYTHSTTEHPIPSLPIPSIRTPASVTMASAKDGNAGDERGSVFSVSGSVVVAENMIGCAMYELVSPTFGWLQ